MEYPVVGVTVNSMYEFAVIASDNKLGFVLPVLNQPDPPNLLLFEAAVTPAPKLSVVDATFELLVLDSVVSVPAFPFVFQVSNVTTVEEFTVNTCEVEAVV